MAYCLIHSSGSHFKAFLYVKATPGATVTATGPKTFSGIADNSGNVMIEIKRKGTYSVTSGSSGATTQSVPILKSRNNYYTNVTGAFTLTISRQNRSNKDFATISVSRSSSPYGPSGTSTGALSTGATVYYGDVLTASATASTGFTGASVGMSGSIQKVDNTYVVGGDCTLIGQANPIAVKLTLTSKSINNLTAATASLNRSSSPYANAGTGNVGAGNGVLFYGDTFTVASTTSNSSAYSTSAPTVSGHASVSSSTYTVGTSDVSVAANADVKTITLTVNASNSTITLARTGSPYKAAGDNSNLLTKTNASGTVSTYYGDKIKWTYSASKDYTISTHKIGSTDRDSGFETTYTGATTFATTATLIPTSLTAMSDAWTSFEQHNLDGDSDWSTATTVHSSNDASVNRYASISGKTLTTYCEKTRHEGNNSDTYYGWDGVAMLITPNKVSLSGKTKVQVNFKVEGSAMRTRFYVFYTPNLPETGTKFLRFPTGIKLFGNHPNGGTYWNDGIYLGAMNAGSPGLASWRTNMQDSGINTTVGQTVTMTRDFYDLGTTQYYVGVYLYCNYYQGESGSSGYFGPAKVTVNSVTFS